MGFALLCSALLSQGRKASSPTRRVVVAVSSQLALADSLGDFFFFFFFGAPVRRTAFNFAESGFRVFPHSEFCGVARIRSA